MRVLAFLITWLALSGSAQAFHEIESFSRTEKGGGNNAFFTGSPRFKGYDCRICHTKTDDTISIGLEVNLPEISQGKYEANTGYVFTVRLIGEHKGLESAFNPNTFMLEIVNDAGESVGDFLPGPAPVELIDERRVIAAEGFGEGENEWSFTWFSPRDPSGALTLYMGMVDGDGAGERELRFIDPLNDDVATMTLRLCPVGGPCPKRAGDPEIESAVHCGVAGESAVPASALLWLLFALVFLPAKRPRSFGLRVGLLALLIGGLGCGASKPPAPGPGSTNGADSGFRLRYKLPASAGLSGEQELAALDKSLVVLRKRAKDLQMVRATFAREGRELIVNIPGANELSVADFRAALPLQGSFSLHLVRHEGSFMSDLCASLADDSMAGVMRIETGLDVWQDGTGATIQQCYLVANDRVAMLNAEEAAAEGCDSRGDAERTRCVVSGRTILKRYLRGRSDITVEPGTILAFASDEASGTGDEIGERYWRIYYLQSAAKVDSTMLKGVSVKEKSEQPEPMLNISLDERGAAELKMLTEENIGRKLAFVIDGRVEVAPTITEALPAGSLRLPLGPTSLPAKTLAVALRSGPLLAALEEVAAEAY